MEYFRPAKKGDETLDDLLLGGMKLFQSASGYRFSLDAVLLAHFADLDRVQWAVDLGTGSGVLMLILASRDPEVKLVGLEYQADLGERARRNVELNHLSGRIQVLTGDVIRIEEYFAKGQAQLVICNPPFWRDGEGKKSRTPEVAIARHEIKAVLEDFIRGAAYILPGGGDLVMIHRTARLPEIFETLKRYNLEPKRVRMVHSFLNKDANLFLLEARKNAKPGLIIQRPFIIYQEDGTYTQELIGYYQGQE